MKARTHLAAAAAALALLGLSGCGQSIADTVTAAAPSAPAPTPPPLSEAEPPLPLPQTDDYRTPAERAYLTNLASEDIDLGDDSRAIEIGHKVCDVLDAGGTLLEVSDVIASTGSYGNYEAGYIAGSAAAAFCPEHLEEVQG